MPYIIREEQKQILPEVEVLAKAIESLGPLHPGRVNFAICKLLHYLYYYNDFGYKQINEVDGILSNVSKELTRRFTVPYEDKKCEENGDVF